MSEWFTSDVDAESLPIDVRASMATGRLWEAFGLNRDHFPNWLSSSSAGPDLVLADAPRLTVIELKVATRPEGLLAAPSRLVSQALRYRRQFHGDVDVILIVVALAVDAVAAEDSERLNRAVARVMRGASPEGFDQVLISDNRSPSNWLQYASDIGRPERFEGLQQLAARVLNASSVTRRKQSLGDEPTKSTETQKQDPPTGSTRVLLVADEWSSGRGGISTVNRGLAVGFSEIGCEVAVVAPEASTEDIEAARALNVDLVTPDPVPGLSGKELLLLPPRFNEPGWKPDVIVGHGRILGPYAYAVRNQYYPTAKLIHVVHMDASRLEKAKETGTSSRMSISDEREAVEVELAESADVVAGVGKTLSEYIDGAMRGRVSPRPPVVTLVPGMRAWRSIADAADMPPRKTILLLARADDVSSKGIDIAVRAVKNAAVMTAKNDLERPTIVVRGVPRDQQDEILASLNSLARPDIEVYLRPYSINDDDLLSDLLSSRLVLMPSRHEGFGLVGLEAIAAAVPVLISAESGLARLLIEETTDSDRVRSREILDVAGNEEEVLGAWTAAIQRILEDPYHAYERAADLRSQLADKATWKRAAQSLLAALTA